MSRRSFRSLGQRPHTAVLEQLEGRLLFAFADLSDWTGSGNTTAPNSYATSGLPATTAGGTFQSRVATTSFLSDPTIGSALGQSTSFSMSGTITFNTPTGSQVDPVWFVGFYNATTPTHRVGLSAANANATTGDKLRFQTQATNSAGTGTTQVDLANGANEDIPDGTYAFSFTYNGSTHSMTATIGSFTATTSYAYAGAADLNRFGLLQAATTANTATFTTSISNINYTGETQLSGAPATPTGLSATAGSGQVTLNWNDVANETGYTIERATNSTFTAGVATTPVGANVTSTTIGSLTNGTTYWFHIRANNASGSSAYSSPPVSATPAAAGSTFYVDLDSGSDAAGVTGASPATAWRTMAHALASVPTATNSTVLIVAGNYTQSQLITADPSPSRTGTVTFKPVTPGTVTFTGTSATSFTPINWTGVKRVRLEGFNFASASTRIVQTQNFAFVNNDITDAALNVYGADFATVDGNNFHGYTTNGNAILFRSYNNFEFPGTPRRTFRADHVTITNNDIDLNLKEGDGIHVESGTAGLIKGNDIRNVRTTATIHGDSMQLLEIDDFTIDGNIMSGGRGIILMHFLNADNSPYLPVIPGVNHDNTFTNNVHASGNDFSLKIADAPNAKVINNTFWGSSTGAGSGLVFGGGVTQATVVNNILRVLDTHSTMTYRARGNNLIDFTYNNRPSYPTLFTGEVNVASTFSSNFVDYTNRDLHLKPGAQGIDGGKNNGDTVQGDLDANGIVDAALVSVTSVPALDFDGQAMTGTKKDIGAYEL